MSMDYNAGVEGGRRLQQGAHAHKLRGFTQTVPALATDRAIPQSALTHHHS